MLYHKLMKLLDVGTNNPTMFLEKLKLFYLIPVTPDLTPMFLAA